MATTSQALTAQLCQPTTQLAASISHQPVAANTSSDKHLRAAHSSSSETELLTTATLVVMLSEELDDARSYVFDKIMAGKL